MNISELAVVGDGCKIDETAEVEPFAVIYSGTVIGKNVIVRSGAKVGMMPFNFNALDGEQQYQRGPILGVVVVKDGAEIGCNSVIQKGVERDTVIGEGSIINSLCNIGHDVQIGKNVLFGLGCSISGFAKIGDLSVVAPGCTILNRVLVGERASIGSGSLVIHDVENGTVVTGRPAINLSKFKEERKRLAELLGTDFGSRVQSSSKRKWSKFLLRKFSLFRQKYLTW